MKERRHRDYMVLSAATDLLTTAVAFGTGVLIARYLGPYDRGLYTLVTTTGFLFAYIAGLGLFDSLLARNATPAKDHQIVALSLGLAGSAGMLVMATLTGEFSFAVYGIAPLLWGVLQISLARAAIAQDWSWLYLRALPNGIQIVITIALWISGHLSVQSALSAMLFGYFIALLCDRLLNGRLEERPTQRWSILQHGSRQHLLNLPRMANYRGPILVLGAVADPEQVGYFAVASAIGSLVPTLTWSLTQNLLVLTARRGHEAKKASQVLTIVGYGSSGLAAVAFIFAGEGLLSLIYGDQFSHTWPALVTVISVQGFWLHSGLIQVKFRAAGVPHWAAGVECFGLALMVTVVVLLRDSGYMSAAYGTAATTIVTLCLSLWVSHWRKASINANI